jgi:hypothetical protein
VFIDPDVSKMTRKYGRDAAGHFAGSIDEQSVAATATVGASCASNSTPQTTPHLTLRIRWT